MSVLVTGGAGFIGSHLVEKLVALEDVVVIDDLSLGNKDNLKEIFDKIVFYEKSICDDLNEIFERHKFSGVFHVAALPRVQFSIKEPIKTHDVNVNGTLNLLDMCRKYDVKRFVFSSSSSIYGDQDEMPYTEDTKPNPMSPYALHKLAGEYYCKMFNFLYGVESISLRYFNVYGERQSSEGGYACLIPKFARMLKSGEIPVINGDGEQTRDFTYVGDVVEANVLAYKTGNQMAFGNAFNVGGGNDYSVNFVTSKIKEIIESDIEARHGEPVIEPKHTLADISKIRDVLGWEPKTGFEEGLRKSVDSFRV